MNCKNPFMLFTHTRPHRLTGEGMGFLNPESPFESGWGCQGRVVQRTGPRSSKPRMAVSNLPAPARLS
jgi:hypothetical protein